MLNVERRSSLPQNKILGGYWPLLVTIVNLLSTTYQIAGIVDTQVPSSGIARCRTRINSTGHSDLTRSFDCRFSLRWRGKSFTQLALSIVFASSSLAETDFFSLTGYQRDYM